MIDSRGTIEAVIDICALLVTGLRLGLPAEEDDLSEKLASRESFRARRRVSCVA
jgi:uncharacterized protein YutE (UPF0331/DUF86 family)